jgi:hypothetical protein
MPSQNHTHTYVQFKARPGYFRCAAPDCTHFLIREAVIGKNSLCNDCGQSFLLTLDAAKLRKPRCLMCRNTKQARAFQTGQQFMAGLLNNTVEDIVE